MLRFLTALTALLVADFTAAADPPKVSQRWAVLIGVDDYIQAEDLKFCGADQRALCDRLVAAGFPTEQILLLEDKAADQKYLPFKSNIEKQLDLVLGVVAKNDLVVVAFSGHGVHLEGKSFFCPKDADLEKPDTLVALDKVYQRFDDSAASLKVLLVDACRNDPRPPGRRSVGGVSPRDEARAFTRSLESLPEGVVLLNSCTAGEISWEDVDLGHGVFMNYILEGLGGAADGDANGRVSINELSRYANTKTKSYVVRKFNDSQRPFLKGDLTLDVLDFEFAKAAVAVPTIPTTPPTQPPAMTIPTNPKPGDVFTNAIGMKLTFIPAGEFMMGTPDSEGFTDGDEKPQHRVRITKPYYLGIHEVTQAQWRAVMDTSPWTADTRVRGGTDYPASNMTWTEATEFCRKLSTREGRSYRLPTEAEWEYACRAGTTTKYSSGGDVTRLSDYAWFGGINESGTVKKNEQYAHAVGMKRPNPWGLYDMHGNVREWCDDWYDQTYYATLPQDDPAGPATGTLRSSRGGDWYLTADFCTSAVRDGGEPTYRSPILGFRVVLVP